MSCTLILERRITTIDIRHVNIKTLQLTSKQRYTVRDHFINDSQSVRVTGAVCAAACALLTR